MRFLADGGISPRTVEFLNQSGHEAVHVRTLGMQRAPDREVINRALADASVVLTFDLDFGEVLAVGVLDKPSVIIFRLGAILDEAQREPIVIRRQDRDIAVVLSMADYERLRTGNIQAFLDLRNEVAARAAANGLTEERLAELLTTDEA